MSLAKLLLLVGALVSWTYTLSAQYQLKVDRSLQKQLSSGSEVDVLVVLHDQLDLSSQPPQGSKLEKGRAVFEALWVHAAQSQLGVRELLRRMGIPHESFFIVNALAVTTRKEVVERLSILPAVASIRALPSHRMIDPQPTVQAQARAVGEIPWGLQLIGADEVWASDITGRGVVVGGQDTGVEWDHPALLNNYRGLLMDSVDHSYHWYDAIEAISPLHQDSMITDTTNPCGLNLQAPCDDARSSHGTHTMGTMVGYDRSTNTHVGVAPDAQWIAVRNMERGYGSPETYLRGFQWFLAPTDLHGQHPEPAMAPHVINNSWSCPTLEGCFESTYDLLEVAINNLRAAGIVVVASAGNSGAKGCATIASPPAIFEGSFTVGSVDQNDSISSFSSRGPAIIDGSKLWKPNVSAPGRGVLSATKGGGYGMLTGTSMAGPHVAGLVALMISANPSLAGDVEKIEQIIEHTAVQKTVVDSCAAETDALGKNTAHGFGRIDAREAVRQAQQLTGVTEIPTDLSGVSVVPNPTSDEIRFVIPNGVQPTRIIFYNYIGNMVLQIDQPSDLRQTGRLSFDVHDWPTNIYYYVVTHDEGNASGSFIVK